jgi:hypothetical protein
MVDSEDDETLSQTSKQAPVARGHAVTSGKPVRVSARTAFNLFDDEQDTAGNMDAVNDSDSGLEELGKIEREREADTYLSYRFTLLAGCGNFFSCLSIHPEIFAGPWGCLRDVSHPLPSRLHKRFLLSGSSSCFLYWQYYVHCSSCLSIHPEIFADPWGSLRDVSHPLPR